jgi:hypothetical protein
MEELNRAFNAHEFDAQELVRRQKELTERHKLATGQAFREARERWERMARLANLVLPIGWLPLGVTTSAEGRSLPALLGLAAMTLIGVVGLRRAYATMVDQYQGRSTARTSQPPTAVRPAVAPSRRRLLLESRLPGLSEQASAIALGGFCSLLRSPEAKMALLTPVLICAIFGSMMFGGRQEIPLAVRPVLATGAMALVLLGVVQLTANQFGMDRDGFRVFVLCPASRRDILLGKDLAHAPLVLGMGVPLLAIMQMIFPMRLDHLLAMVPQFVSMFVLFCLLTNLLSIYAPVHVPAGSLRPSNFSLSTVLLQVLAVTIVFPLTQGLVLLPLGTEMLLRYLGWTRGLPVCLALSLVECAAALLFFHVTLRWQGRLLQEREQRILETVTNRAP